jgi:uncharacterized protein involved in exopolysaccharide biosynthesis
VEEAFSEVRLQDAAYNVPWRERIIYRVMYRGLMAVVLVAWAVTLASLLQTPTYEASAEVRVDQEREDQQTYPLTRSGQEIQTLPPPGKGVQAFLPTIRVFIESRRVAEEATQRLGFEMTPEELLDNLDPGTLRARILYASPTKAPTLGKSHRSSTRSARCPPSASPKQAGPPPS